MASGESLTPGNPELNGVILSESANHLEFAKAEGPKPYFEGREFKPALLADHLVKEVFFYRQIISFATEAGYETLRYVPEKGVYVEDKGGEWLNRVIKDILGTEAKRSRISDVVHLIQVQTAINRNEFKQPSHILVLQNGVFDLSIGTLVEFSPEFNATSALPVSYDPVATCPTINKYLEGVQPTWTETGRDATDALVEYTSYFLFKGLPIHRFLILVGQQGTGKGTWLNLNTAFLGDDNACSVSLQAVDNDQYAAALLYGKAANICSDISSKALKTSGFLKATTGFDHITCNRKYLGHLKFRWTGKHLFSANEVPASYDTSDAFHIRALLIEFPNVFRGTDKDDQQLLEKLTQPQELSGLLNLCLNALPHLIMRGYFKDEPTLAERKLNYLRLSDPAAYFVEVKLEPDLDSETTNKELYECYRLMCLNELKVRPLSNTAFGKTLARVLSFGELSADKVEGRTTSVWHGVRIKDAPKDTEEPPQEPPPGQSTLDNDEPAEYDEDMIAELASFTKRLGGRAEYGQAKAHLEARGFTIPGGGLPLLVRTVPRFRPVDGFRFALVEGS